MIALKISGCGSGIASRPPSSRPSTKRTLSPAATWILPSLIRPTRIFGPCRSWQDGDRAAGLLLERADGGVDLAVVVMRRRG